VVEMRSGEAKDVESELELVDLVGLLSDGGGDVPHGAGDGVERRCSVAKKESVTNTSVECFVYHERCFVLRGKKGTRKDALKRVRTGLVLSDSLLERVQVALELPDSLSDELHGRRREASDQSWMRSTEKRESWS
jgi:hypothetical protein